MMKHADSSFHKIYSTKKKAFKAIQPLKSHFSNASFREKSPEELLYNSEIKSSKDFT